MLTVFYGNQVYGEYLDWPHLMQDIWPNTDLYNGGIVYDDSTRMNIFSGEQTTKWWRVDRTPMLIEDVPATCKAWLLIL